jgi:hypothetical protein
MRLLDLVSFHAVFLKLSSRDRSPRLEKMAKFKDGFMENNFDKD